MTRNARPLDWAILSNLVDDKPSEDLHYLLRCADLVTNPDTTSETINDLASGPSKAVRMKAAEHPNISNEKLKKLAQTDPNLLVRETAAKKQTERLTKHLETLNPLQKKLAALLVPSFTGSTLDLDETINAILATTKHFNIENNK